MSVHLIHALTFDFDYPGQAPDSVELADWVKEALLPVIEKVLDRQAADGLLLAMPRIELDLGTVAALEASSEIPRRLFEQLTLALERHVEAGTTAPGAGLLAFLGSGTLPWSAAGDVDHRTLLRRLVATPQAPAVLLTALREPAMLTRLLRQFDRAELLAVAAALFGHWPPAERDAVLRWSADVLQGQGAVPVEAFWRWLLAQRDEPAGVTVLAQRWQQTGRDQPFAIDNEENMLRILQGLERADFAMLAPDWQQILAAPHLLRETRVRCREQWLRHFDDAVLIDILGVLQPGCGWLFVRLEEMMAPLAPLLRPAMADWLAAIPDSLATRSVIDAAIAALPAQAGRIVALLADAGGESSPASALQIGSATVGATARPPRPVDSTRLREPLRVLSAIFSRAEIIAIDTSLNTGSFAALSPHWDRLLVLAPHWLRSEYPRLASTWLDGFEAEVLIDILAVVQADCCTLIEQLASAMPRERLHAALRPWLARWFEVDIDRLTPGAIIDAVLGTAARPPEGPMSRASLQRAARGLALRACPQFARAARGKSGHRFSHNSSGRALAVVADPTRGQAGPRQAPAVPVPVAADVPVQSTQNPSFAAALLSRPTLLAYLADCHAAQSRFGHLNSAQLHALVRAWAGFHGSAGQGALLPAVEAGALRTKSPHAFFGRILELFEMGAAIDLDEIAAEASSNKLLAVAVSGDADLAAASWHVSLRTEINAIERRLNAGTFAALAPHWDRLLVLARRCLDRFDDDALIDILAVVRAECFTLIEELGAAFQADRRPALVRPAVAKWFDVARDLPMPGAVARGRSQTDRRISREVLQRAARGLALRACPQFARATRGRSGYRFSYKSVGQARALVAETKWGQAGPRQAPARYALVPVPPPIGAPVPSTALFAKPALLAYLADSLSAQPRFGQFQSAQLNALKRACAGFQADSGFDRVLELATLGAAIDLDELADTAGAWRESLRSEIGAIETCAFAALAPHWDRLLVLARSCLDRFDDDALIDILAVVQAECFSLIEELGCAVQGGRRPAAVRPAVARWFEVSRDRQAPGATVDTVGADRRASPEVFQRAARGLALRACPQFARARRGRSGYRFSYKNLGQGRALVAETKWGQAGPRQASARYALVPVPPAVRGPVPLNALLSKPALLAFLADCGARQPRFGQLQSVQLDALKRACSGFQVDAGFDGVIELATLGAAIDIDELADPATVWREALRSEISAIETCAFAALAPHWDRLLMLARSGLDRFDDDALVDILAVVQAECFSLIEELGGAMQGERRPAAVRPSVAKWFEVARELLARGPSQDERGTSGEELQRAARGLALRACPQFARARRGRSGYRFSYKNPRQERVLVAETTWGQAGPRQASARYALVPVPPAAEGPGPLFSKPALLAFLSDCSAAQPRFGQIKSVGLDALKRACAGIQVDAGFDRVLELATLGAAIDLDEVSPDASMMQAVPVIMPSEAQPSAMPESVRQRLPQRLADAMLRADLSALDGYWDAIVRHYPDTLAQAARRYLGRADARHRLVAKADEAKVRDLLSCLSSPAAQLVAPLLDGAATLSQALPEALAPTDFTQRVLCFALGQVLDRQAPPAGAAWIAGLLAAVAPVPSSDPMADPVAYAWYESLRGGGSLLEAMLEQALFGNACLAAVQRRLRGRDADDRSNPDSALPDPLLHILTDTLCASHAALTDCLLGDGGLGAADPALLSAAEWQLLAHAQLPRQQRAAQQAFWREHAARLATAATQGAARLEQLQGAFAAAFAVLAPPALPEQDLLAHTARRNDDATACAGTISLLLMRAAAPDDVAVTSVMVLTQRLLAAQVSDCADAHATLSSALAEQKAIDRLSAILPSPTLARLLCVLRPALAGALPVLLRELSGSAGGAEIAPSAVPAMLDKAAWRAIYHAIFAAPDAASDSTLSAALREGLAGEAGKHNPASAMAQLLLPLAGLPVQRVKPSMSRSGEASAPTSGDANLRNAGMVLIAPYIERLFSLLDITIEGRFADDAARQRAVHLLQYAVTAQEATPEYLLSLNKLLCGVPAAEPVLPGILISEKEKDVIEQMLKGVIANWSAIGDSSVAGLRETFLQRDGSLRFADEAWHLKIMPGTFDMLLDRLPWAYKMIKFSWMAAPLHVTWR